MKNGLLAIILLLFTLHCTAQDKTIIAKGQMPAICKDKQQNIHLVYGSGDSILYTFSNDRAVSYAVPQLVSILPGLVAHATRGPQIAITDNGIAIIAVNVQGDIYSYTKEATGKWIKGGKVNDRDSTNKEGFLGLSSDGQHTLFAVWLDIRTTQRNKLYGAKSVNGGRSWQKNILVYASPDSTVCECCKPSVAMKSSKVYVMFRNWLHGNRDLYLVQSKDAGVTFETAQKLGSGSWTLNACPMDGGSLTVDNNGNIATVWRRENTIYACQPGKTEKALGEGKGCTMETVNGKNVYAWSASGNITCLLPDGNVKIIGKGNLPLLKSVSNKEVICVWENNKQIESALLQL